MTQQIKDRNSDIICINDIIIYEGKTFQKKLEVVNIKNRKIYGMDINDGKIYSFNASKNRKKISLYETNRKISYSNLVALIESTEHRSIF